jgi:ADP-ribose pyrophosphatase YjhB (NUDIX family)
MAHETTMTPAQQIALWADKLRDMSAMGLHYTKDIYDQQRYREMQTMAMEMHALATGDPLESLEPLRDTVYAHPGPFSVGDAAVIDTAGRILLIQRADNKKWAMPGGALEVGETPAHGVVREALEEAGTHCEPVALVGVFDSRLNGSSSRYHLYAFVFLCRLTGKPDVTSPSHAHEVVGKGWFSEADLPHDLSPSHAVRIAHAFRVWRGGESFFDH